MGLNIASITHFNYAPFFWPKFPIAHGKNPQRNRYASGFCHALSKIYSQPKGCVIKKGYTSVIAKNGGIACYAPNFGTVKFWK